MTDHKFEPFQRVMVRDRKEHKWKIDFFSHNDGDQEFPFCCMCGDFRCCIPYTDETAHLLGTTQPYEPPKPIIEYAFGEKVEALIGKNWGTAVFLLLDTNDERIPYKVYSATHGLYWVSADQVRPLTT